MEKKMDIHRAIRLVRTAHEALQFAREHVPETMWETINCNASYEIEHLLCALQEEERRERIAKTLHIYGDN